jgi:hypothetical protein
MRRLVLCLCLAVFPFAVAATTASAAGSATSFSFNLEGPALVENPNTGETLRLTGAGTFNPSAGTVTAGGSFTHFRSDGSVFLRGTWAATTGFTSFTAFGGPNNGLQGGVLAITVTLFPDGGAPVPDVPMTITCMIFAPPGTEEGVTLAGFTELISGTTVLHIAS